MDDAAACVLPLFHLVFSSTGAPMPDMTTLLQSKGGAVDDVAACVLPLFELVFSLIGAPLPQRATLLWRGGAAVNDVATCVPPLFAFLFSSILPDMATLLIPRAERKKRRLSTGDEGEAEPMESSRRRSLEVKAAGAS